MGRNAGNFGGDSDSPIAHPAGHQVDDFLCSFDPDGKETQILAEVGTSNGIGWSPDGRLMCEPSIPGTG